MIVLNIYPCPCLRKNIDLVCISLAVSILCLLLVVICSGRQYFFIIHNLDNILRVRVGATVQNKHTVL